MSVAITDAAIMYGAQRYFDGLHRDPEWQFKDNYREEDDQLLFLELMHSLILYDELVLDDSSMDDDVSKELLRFIGTVNAHAGKQVIRLEKIGKTAVGDHGNSVRYRASALLKELLQTIPGIEERISSVPVPWAYYAEAHYDRDVFALDFKHLQLDPKWIPFAIFAWRALMYSAFARHKQRRGSRNLTYVAAPGRMKALEIVLNAPDRRRFEFPRQAWRALLDDLPDLPEDGLDFDYLTSLSPVETSGLSRFLWSVTPQEALQRTMDLRDGSEGVAARADWKEILFKGAETCAVGGVNIQIVRNSTIGGDLNQIIHAYPPFW
jgi:hypothetical protein